MKGGQSSVVPRTGGSDTKQKKRLAAGDALGKLKVGVRALKDCERQTQAAATSSNHGPRSGRPIFLSKDNLFKSIKAA